LLALALASPLRADSPSNAEAAAILKQLDTIETKQRDAQKGNLNDILTQVNEAKEYTDAALKLYQKAVFTVRFDGAKGDQGAYAKWTKDNDDLFRDPVFARALSLHLQYLALTIQAARGDDPIKLTDPVTDFVRSYWDYEPQRPGSIDQQRAAADKSGRPAKETKESQDIRNLLDQSVAGATIALYFQVDTILANVDNWNLIPSAYADTFSKEIFPPLRDAKKPELVGIWDEFIAHETDHAEKNALADKRAHFENEDLPTLRWRRAEDLAAIGQTGTGTSQMLEIIQTFPLHPDNPKWIAELRSLLQPASDKK
jgi:hypothetical protein